jgi:predicted ABC-type transport system involved in lysophospholipase L1 biosynthesis ATPase subunit
MQEPIVQIRNLAEVCGHGQIEVKALDCVNLDIAAGKFLALMGPSESKGALQVKVQLEDPDEFLTPELTAKVDFLAD